MNKRRRLFFDIETSPNIGMFWQAGYKQRIDYSNIIKERAIICICYKWEGSKEVFSLNWDRKQNDKAMLKKFVEVANMATEIVGHNGDKFDLPWIRTRCLHHKIPLFPNYCSIDTLKAARRKFKFNSNRLDYIASYLGIGKKIKTEFDLWKDIVLHNSKQAMDKMVKYCKKDVVLLEEVFKAMSAHMDAKTHFGVVVGEDRCSCPNCGSYEHTKVRIKVTATGYERRQLQCNSCHHHFTTGKDYYDKNINKFL